MILVTGGTGMVGAHLLVQLTQQGKRVKALRRKHADLSQVKQLFEWHNCSPRFDAIEWVEGDMLDLFSIKSCMSDVDTVYHSAAIVSFDKRRRLEILESNRVGTSNLVDVALEYGVSKFCHVSSIASLGNAPEGLKINEDCIWDGDANRSNYSKSKYLSEMEVWRGQTEGLDVVIVNPSVILGAGNWDNGSPKFFSTVDKGMKFYTSGGTGFVDVQDVVKAMIELTKNEQWDQVKNQRYVVSAENLQYRTLFNTIADHLNKQRPTVLAGDFVLGLGWRLSSFMASIRRKPATLTKESARSSKSISKYSSEKLFQTIGFTYQPIEKTIERIANNYLQMNR